MKLTYLFALAPHSQLGTEGPAEVGGRGQFMVGGFFYTLSSNTSKPSGKLRRLALELPLGYCRVLQI